MYDTGHGNDAVVRECALLAVKITTIDGAIPISASAVLGDWAVTPNNHINPDGRFVVTHVPTGRKITHARGTLTEIAAMRVLVKISKATPCLDGLSVADFTTEHKRALWLCLPAHARKHVHWYWEQS